MNPNNFTPTTHSMPFGKHRDQPLPSIPSSYLFWAFRTLKLSTGLLELANAFAAPSPVLDVLLQSEELGVELVSDGKSVRIAGDGWKRVPHELMDLVRQVNHTIAGLLGKTTTPPTQTQPSTTTTSRDIRT